MVGRLLTVAAVVASLVGFIAQETGSSGWWVYALSRSSYVLVVLAVAAALMSRRTASAIVVGAQVLTAATALAFSIVAIVKYWGAFPFTSGIQSQFAWETEAGLLSVATLAFALTLARRSTTAAMAGLAAAMLLAVGSGIYAITLKETIPAFMWWSLAGVGAFLAAAAAASLERGGTVMSSPAVPRGAGGGPGSDAGVE
jgi:hypothetical protein